MTSESSASTPIIDPLSAAKAIWWIVLLRGVFAIMFGIVALLLPGVALLSIVFVFAAYAVVDGVINIAHAVRVRGRDRRWGWLLVQGILTVLAGVAAFVFPGLAGLFGALVLLWTIVIWSIVMGISGIGAAASLADGGRKVLAFVAAILSIVFGIVLAIITIVTPVATAQSLIWVVGVYAILFGGMLVGLAIQARGIHAKRVGTASPKVA